MRTYVGIGNQAESMNAIGRSEKILGRKFFRQGKLKKEEMPKLVRWSTMAA